jgi:hypothetical protein
LCLSYATSGFEIHLKTNPDEKLTVVQVVKKKKLQPILEAQAVLPRTQKPVSVTLAGDAHVVKCHIYAGLLSIKEVWRDGQSEQ